MCQNIIFQLVVIYTVLERVGGKAVK